MLNGQDFLPVLVIKDGQCKMALEQAKGTDNMSDIAASERRLSSALDRMDQLLESQSHAGEASDAGPSQDKLKAAEAKIAQLQEALQEKRSSAQADDAGARADVTAQLTALTEANAELIEANRKLLAESADVDGVILAAVQALEAELQAVHATRDAEVKQLGSVVAQLERLLGQAAPTTAGAAGKGNAKKSDEQSNQGLFSGIYSDAPDEEKK